MKKSTKVWLIIAITLIFAGVIIFGYAMTMVKSDFTKLSAKEYEIKAHEITETFKNISINTDTADIVFVLSENDKCTVSCREQKNLSHLVMVKDDTLVIEVEDTRKWYEYIGINFGSSKITIALPEIEYASLYIEESTGDVEIPKDFKFKSIDVTVSTGDIKNYASAAGNIKLKTSTGKILVENISSENLDLSVSTGKTLLKNINCKNLVSRGSTGDITLINVIAEEKLSIERSTGDVKFEDSDAAEIFIETDTGDVTGSLLTSKEFITETDTGKVDVPTSATGSRCEITTDTGDIKINVK